MGSVSSNSKENKQVAATLKAGRLVHVEGSGHTVRWDQENRFLDSLDRFLNNL